MTWGKSWKIVYGEWPLTQNFQSIGEGIETGQVEATFGMPKELCTYKSNTGFFTLLPQVRIKFVFGHLPNTGSLDYILIS